MVRYVVPRAPYRCKDCWSRFWRLENPWKTTKAKLGALLAVLLIVGLFSLPFFGPKPSGTGDSAETPEESYTLPVPTHRSAQRAYDASERPAGASGPESAPETLSEATPSEVTPKVESDAADETDAAEATFAQSETADSTVSDPGTAESSSDLTPMAGAPTTADPASSPGSETPTDGIPPIATGPTEAAESGAASPPSAEATQDETRDETPSTASTADATSVAASTESAARAASVSGPDARSDPVPESAPTTSGDAAAVSPETEAAASTTADLPPAPKGPRTLEGLTPRSDGSEFELTARAGGPVRQTHIFPLSDPPKLVIDLAGKWDRKVTSPVAVENPLVKRIRLGNHPDYLRLVLDLADAGPLGHEMTPTVDGFRLRVFPEGGS
jgi:hypothetical protein